MQEIIKAIAQWLAPIIGTAISAYIAVIQHNGESKRDSAVEATEENRRKEAEWRDSVTAHMQAQDEQMKQMTTSQQITMRTMLIHNAEKYFTRGSITPEEQASWDEMHDKYSGMGFNGLIDSYREKIDALPHVTIDALIKEERL